MSGETFISNECCKFGSYKQVEKCFSTITEFYLEILKTFIKLYVRHVFVNVRWNFIFSRHHVQQGLKNYLQPCSNKNQETAEKIQRKKGLMPCETSHCFQH